MPVVTLIGYRGTGKSTVAVELARRLGCAWHDADAELERALGTSIAALVAARGEGVFRDEEAARLVSLLAAGDGVLATGGGVVLRPANRDLLRRQGGLVVWLTAPADVIRSRLAADPATVRSRPALSGSDPLLEVDAALVAREPLYRECAAMAIDTAVMAPREVAAAIVARLPGRTGGGEPAGPDRGASP